MSIFKDCEHRVYSKGHKTIGGGSMPYGIYYLPGDEPGYKCEYSDEHCNENEINVDDCPKFELSVIPCPSCNDDVDDIKDIVHVYYDKYEIGYYCDCCGNSFDLEIAKECIKI